MFYKGINEHENIGEGQYYHALNMVNDSGILINEEGTYKLDTTDKFFSSKQLIGVVTYKESSILFFVPTEIGVLKKNDSNQYVYTKCLALPELNFSAEHPIQGTCIENVKGNIEVAFTDGYNHPRLVVIDNLDSPIALDAENEMDTRLFPPYKISEVTLNAVKGGSLLSGSYMVAFAYKNSDGTVTSYSPVSNPSWVSSVDKGSYDLNYGDEGGKQTAYQLEVTIHENTMVYEQIIIAVIRKVKGVVEAFIGGEFTNREAPAKYYITSLENKKSVNLTEVITSKAQYATVGTLTLHDDRLYAGNLTVKEIPNVQYLVNQLDIRYTTTLSDIKDTRNPNQNQLDGQQKWYVNKSFQHGEVYALYIRFADKDGSFSRWYHIPGRAENIGDRNAISNPERADSGFSYAPRKFHVKDTCDAVTQKMGFWENTNEYYPEEGGFPNDLGALTPVRHHKFPSYRFMKTYHYASEERYGIDKLDYLGLKIENTDILQELSQYFATYQIGYAKRNYANSTVVCTDILQFGARPTVKSGYITVITPTELVKWKTANTGKAAFEGVWSTGGNYGVRVSDLDYNESIENSLLVTYEVVRFHAFDLMVKQPSLSNLYIDNQFKLTTVCKNVVLSGIDGRESQLNIFDYTLRKDGQRTFTMNIYEEDTLRTLSNHQYIPAHVITDRIWNSCSEGCFVADINGKFFLDVNTAGLGFDSPKIQIGDIISYTGAADNSSRQRYMDYGTGQGERTYFTVLKQDRQDVYTQFSDQDIALAGTRAIDSYEPIINGDVFFGTNSWVATSAPHSGHGITAEAVVRAPDNWGIFSIKRHLAVGVHNMNMRYQGGNLEQKFYPAYNYTEEDVLNMLAHNENNDWSLYDLSQTFVNDFVPAVIHDGDTVFITNFPYRITRSALYGKEAQVTTLKTWLVNDKYECEKKAGTIMNLASLGDTLIIHHQTGLFITRSKASLSADDITVSIGTGDIFALAPKEVLPKSGSAGTYHKHACIVTKLGYIFPDAAHNRVFLFTGSELEELSAIGLKRFFTENLSPESTKVHFKKMRVPYRRTCIKGVTILVIPKSQSDYDTAPLSTDEGIIYDIEYTEKGVSYTSSVQLRTISTLKPAAVRLVRSHYWLYLNEERVLPETGFIWVDCFVKDYQKIYTDNPFMGIGFSLVYDEEYNRLILAKNSRAYSKNIEHVKGHIGQKSLPIAFEHGDLVEYGNNPTGQNKIYKLNLDESPVTTYRIAMFENGIDDA